MFVVVAKSIVSNLRWWIVFCLVSKLPWPSPYIYLLHGHHNNGRQCLPCLSRCCNRRDDNSCRDWRAAASVFFFSPFHRLGEVSHRRVIICPRSYSSRSKVLWKQNSMEHLHAWYCLACSRMSRQTPTLNCNPFLPDKPKTSCCLSLPWTSSFSGLLALSLSVFTKALLHF